MEGNGRNHPQVEGAPPRPSRPLLCLIAVPTQSSSGFLEHLLPDATAPIPPPPPALSHAEPWLGPEPGAPFLQDQLAGAQGPPGWRGERRPARTALLSADKHPAGLPTAPEPLSSSPHVPGAASLAPGLGHTVLPGVVTKPQEPEGASLSTTHPAAF